MENGIIDVFFQLNLHFDGEKLNTLGNPSEATWAKPRDYAELPS
jgi:hypothetical protein